MAAPGQFVSDNSDPAYGLLVNPPGKYRTRLGWLLSSFVAFEHSASIFDPLRMARPDLYVRMIAGEQQYVAGLTPKTRYRYKQLLLRDLARIQIQHIKDSQSRLVLIAMPKAVLADLAAAFVVSGIGDQIARIAEAETDIVSIYLRGVDRDSQRYLIATYAFVDLQIRYGELLERSLFESARKKLGKQVSARDIAEWFSESAVSSAIGTWVKKYEESPGELLSQFRRQVALDVAAFQCACYLVPGRFAPPAAWTLAFGGDSGYRTRLAYLLSLKLAPPSTTVVNAISGGQVDALLADELGFVADLKPNNKSAFQGYLRGFLADMEMLEAQRLAQLQSGPVATFLKGAAINALFGAFALGSGPGAEIAAILANAGYEGLDTYESLDAEIKVRSEMAALRETVLDSLFGSDAPCGCGAGVIVVPKSISKGE